jgi:hypothetical protein
LDISIIEFLVYGFITYASLLMLIISAIRETPSTKAHSIVRAIYLIPGFICAILLAGSGINIEMETTTSTDLTNETVYDSAGALTWTTVVNGTQTQTNTFALQNPVWVILHYMIALILLVYVILQVLILFTKIE